VFQTEQLFNKKTLPFRPKKKKRRKPERRAKDTSRRCPRRTNRRASKIVACRLLRNNRRVLQRLMDLMLIIEMLPKIFEFLPFELGP
jgi:hypothetical protein